MPTKEEVKEEARWAAESDARTLAEANVIIKNSKRVAAVKKAAKRMVVKKIIDAKNVVEHLNGLLELAGQSDKVVEGMKIIPKVD